MVISIIKYRTWVTLTRLYNRWRLTKRRQKKNIFLRKFASFLLLFIGCIVIFIRMHSLGTVPKAHESHCQLIMSSNTHTHTHTEVMHERTLWIHVMFYDRNVIRSMYELDCYQCMLMLLLLLIFFYSSSVWFYPMKCIDINHRHSNIVNIHRVFKTIYIVSICVWSKICKYLFLTALCRINKTNVT